jgi:quercetin dioxygenase-like cupin family protein
MGFDWERESDFRSSQPNWEENTTMIRCIRLWSGPDGNSHFEEGVVDIEFDMLSGKFPIASVLFQQTNSDPKLGWHPDPARQLVITMSGALEFTTHDGRFSLRAGDILFTEDTVAGHDWRLLGEQPWRRAYAILDQATVVPFRPTDTQLATAGEGSRKANAAAKTGAAP